jgi:hypothetical protein
MFYFFISLSIFIFFLFILNVYVFIILNKNLHYLKEHLKINFLFFYMKELTKIIISKFLFFKLFLEVFNN